MAKTFEQRVVYERLLNGMDVYVLRASSPDVVIAEFAFAGGAYATYDIPLITAFIEHMLPGSTKEHSRTTLLESVDRLGAHISIHADDAYLHVSISCRRTVFPDVVRTVVEVLTRSIFPNNEFVEAMTQIHTSLIHARENTRARAQEVLLHRLYRKGHPHWSPDTTTLARTLPKVTRSEVVSFHKKTLTTVGSTACIVGDIDTEAVLLLLRDVCAMLPMQEPYVGTVLHADRVVETNDLPDSIIPMRDKINVDTYLAIPTLLMRESDTYHAFVIGLRVLGGSANSRLFHTLRTQQSLTYGAYASFQGHMNGYPGYLIANAIFPHDVFARALPVFRDVVRTFVEKGITQKELATRKEETRGKHAVGLSTTTGLSAALLSTVLGGKPIRYLDEYLDQIDALTLRDVNAAISEYLPYDRAVTVAAGAIDQDGKPLA
jgi:zinc protease